MSRRQAATGHFSKSIERDKTVLIHRSQIYDLTATLIYEDQLHPLVELTLGPETRIFRLAEFTDFLLTIVEEDRKVTTAYLDSLEQPTRPKHTRNR